VQAKSKVDRREHESCDRHAEDTKCPAGEKNRRDAQEAKPGQGYDSEKSHCREVTPCDRGVLLEFETKETKVLTKEQQDIFTECLENPDKRNFAAL